MASRLLTPEQIIQSLPVPRVGMQLIDQAIPPAPRAPRIRRAPRYLPCPADDIRCGLLTMRDALGKYPVSSVPRCIAILDRLLKLQ